MAVSVYITDTVMVLCAAGAVASAASEARRQPMRRRHLLIPGLFAMLATILVLAFPEPSDTMDAEFWTVLMVSILVGAVRGAFIGMASDHYWKLVRLDRGWDSLLAAIVVLIVGIIQFAIETSNGAETTFEFILSVVSGYLFGRSIAAYFRARALHHHDLKEV
jgi:CDP-diglyceride synthetase